MENETPETPDTAIPPTDPTSKWSDTFKPRLVEVDDDFIPDGGMQPDELLFPDDE